MRSVLWAKQRGSQNTVETYLAELSFDHIELDECRAKILPHRVYRESTIDAAHILSVWSVWVDRFGLMRDLVSLLKPSMSSVLWTAKMNRSSGCSSASLMTTMTLSTLPYMIVDLSYERNGEAGIFIPGIAHP